MSIKVYFPKNDYLINLVKNFENLTTRYDLVEFNKFDNIIEAFNNNQIDLALVDPLTYAQISGELDYLIVPTKCLSAIGYTEIATIYLGEHLRRIRNLAYCPQNEYLALLSHILLNEKYSVDIETTKTHEISIKSLESFDAILSTDKFDYKNTLDLTEEWFDTFESPLPLAFWIVSEKYATDLITEITNNLFNYQDQENLTTHILEKVTNHYEREGMINYDFSDGFINSLDEIIQLFYQLGVVDDMKDLKILGEDNIQKETL